MKQACIYIYSSIANYSSNYDSTTTLYSSNYYSTTPTMYYSTTTTPNYTTIYYYYTYSSIANYLVYILLYLREK